MLQLPNRAMPGALRKLFGRGRKPARRRAGPPQKRPLPATIKRVLLRAKVYEPRNRAESLAAGALAASKTTKLFVSDAFAEQCEEKLVLPQFLKHEFLFFLGQRHAKVLVVHGHSANASSALY